jgi:hypothetical protein
MKRPWRYQHWKTASRARAATIERLAERLLQETGKPPTDKELARLLATSEAHVRRARVRRGATDPLQKQSR